MKRTLLTLATAFTLSASAVAGTSDKVLLKYPLAVTAYKEDVSNLEQILEDEDKDGLDTLVKAGRVVMIPPGQTVYVVNIGSDDVDTLRYHGVPCYAPNHEVHVIIYGNQ